MLSIDAKVHNHFDFVVQNAKTGEVKQTARAYNVVTDKFFEYVIMNHNSLYYIALGTGSGEPAVTDTRLFAQIIKKQATEIETVKAYPTSYTKKKIVLEPTECVGADITEVGFWGYYYQFSAHSDLMSHAMLKDAEGNPIVVHKTAEDIITVYATFYVTIGTETGGEYVLPSPNNNAILSAIFNNSSIYAAMTLGMSPNVPTADNLANTNVLGSGYKNVFRSADVDNLQWVFGLTRWNYNEGNNHVVSCIGAPTLAVWPLPNPNVMANIELTNIQIGNGDGVTTEFTCPIPIVVEGSEVLRVDGVLMKPGEDYEFDYFNNSAKYIELYASSDPYTYDVSGGNGRQNNSNYSQFYRFGAWCNTAYSEIIDAAHPLVFDFRKSIPVNQLNMDSGAVHMMSGSTAIMSLEYSNDGEQWTEFCNTGTAQNVRNVSVNYHSDTTINARYWRICTTAGSIVGLTRCGFRWGYVSPGIRFKTPPAEGAAITMNCEIDRPLKNENWMLDFTFAVRFQRG